MNQNLRETLGCLALGVVFFVGAYWWFDIIAIVIKWLFYIFAVILGLGALGCLSSYLNSPSFTIIRPSSRKAKRMEAQKRVEFAKEQNITKPFYSDMNGRIFRTSDGKGYLTHEDCFADGVERDWSNVEIL